MKWMRFRIRTLVEAEDILVSSMQDIGLYGAQIENNVPLTAAEKELMFVDILPQARENDGTSMVSFFAEETGNGTLVIDGEERTPEEVRAAVEDKLKELAAYSDIGEGIVTIEETEDVDWINNWKQYFHQFWVDDILIIPSWEKPADPDRVPALTLHIDPGTAFGTGMHETTQLCIRELRQALTPETKILDVWTGSGILSIVALKLGAAHAVGTDLDPQTVPAVADNLYQNGLTDRKADDEEIRRLTDAKEADFGCFRLYLGNLINDAGLQEKTGEAVYDIVAANILPDVLIPLTPQAARALKPGGLYITSGIISGREESVVEAMLSAGLEIAGITAQGEWRCVTGRKPL